MKTHSNCERNYKCPLCGLAFQAGNNLKRHLLVHTREKNFKCPLCDSAFSQRSCLKTHMLIHTGEKNHKCEVCGSSFLIKGNLKLHMRSRHRHEKNCKCEDCGATFSQSSNLKKHLLIHTRNDSNAATNDTFRSLGFAQQGSNQLCGSSDVSSSSATETGPSHTAVVESRKEHDRVADVGNVFNCVATTDISNGVTAHKEEYIDDKTGN